MIVYIIIILFILILRNNGHAYGTGDAINQKSLTYYKFSIILIVTLVMFREYAVDSDAAAYISDYYRRTRLTFSGLFLSRDTHDYVGYYWLSKLFCSMHLPVEIWLGFIQLFYLFSISLIVKRSSKDIMLSLLLYVTFGLLSFSMQALKQTLGVSFMYIAYYFVQEKKYKWSIPCIIYAYLCHSSVLIFLFAIVLSIVKNRKLFYLMLVVAISSFVFINGPVMQFLVDSSLRERYLSYLESDRYISNVMFVFFVLVYAISLFSVKEYHKIDKGNSRLLYGISLFVLIFFALANQQAYYFRLAYLFMPFLMVLLPNSLELIENPQQKKIMSIIFICAISFYCIYTGRDWDYKLIFFN